MYDRICYFANLKFHFFGLGLDAIKCENEAFQTLVDPDTQQILKIDI